MIPLYLVSLLTFSATTAESLSRADGYRGIWYSNQPTNDEYVFKYSGGLGTYCADHIPLAVHAPEVQKTFFVFGGTNPEGNTLLEMVSYYDHLTGTVPRPVILMDKKTTDAHDNPVLSIDSDGHLWVFASSHGTSRPSYLFKSTKPYSIEGFEQILETNFSYPQPWYITGHGFLFLHTRYGNGGRQLFWSTSPDGVNWSEGTRLSMMEMGHYQVSWPAKDKVGTAFNFHPQPIGLNARTNLYYCETPDMGHTWRNASGLNLEIPLTDPHCAALVHDYQSEGLKVYIMDLNYDTEGRPVILYITSKGFEPGPENGPRHWMVAHYNGASWAIHIITESDSNYDAGSIYIEDDGPWRVIGPTESGPQAYNPGGEMVLWISKDQGRTWKKARQITRNSPYNHTYARRPLNAHSDFYAFWADGDTRQRSDSRLYFCDKTGKRVYRLPFNMEGDTARPERVRLK